LVRLVEADGWRHVRTTGSHPHYKHASNPQRRHKIPGHPGDYVPTGMLKSVLTGRWFGDEAMSPKYAVIFEEAESNWAAYVPDQPGCITTGRTLEETERNIREAIQGHLRTLREFGEPPPRPTSLATEIEIPPAA
jgi:predicted RNase H-like HicB family nuclease/predicted RNA binding protein YcfA (HicA-like mRNA interferase family)